MSHLRPARLARAVASLAAALCVLTAASGGGASAATTPPPTPAPFAPPRAPVPCQPMAATSSDVGGARLGLPGLQVAPAAGRPAPPPVQATAWTVVDLTTGDVVAACNAHLRLRPASTLKTLTALALVERLDPQQRFTATAEQTSVDGSKVGLVAGSTYSVLDLLHGMMLPSGNDAATAFGALSGGVARATELMNAEAKRLGADDTNAVNTSGLDADGQVTSAYDLALLAREALRRPWLRGVMTTPTYSFPGRGTATDATRPRYQIQNGNRLLGSYAGTTGGKNGITTLAHGTIWASATRGDRSYVVTVMHAGAPVSPMAVALLDWAFADAAGAAPVGRLVDALPAGAVPTDDPDATPTADGPTAAPDVTTPAATPAATPRTEPVGASTSGGDEVPRLVALGYVLLAVAVGLVVGIGRARAKTNAERRAIARAEAKKAWLDLKSGPETDRPDDVSGRRRGPSAPPP